VLDQGGVVPAAALECLSGGDPARDRELAVAWPTVEGQPIVHFFLVSAAHDVVDLDVSSHFDDFGPKEWTHRTCTVAAARDSRSLLLCGQA